MGFSRQEYWSGLLFPSPGDIPNSAIEHESPASLALNLQADSLPLYIHLCKLQSVNKSRLHSKTYSMMHFLSPGKNYSLVPINSWDITSMFGAVLQIKDTESKRNRTLTKCCCVLKKYADVFISVFIERNSKVSEEVFWYSDIK